MTLFAVWKARWSLRGITELGRDVMPGEAAVSVRGVGIMASSAGWAGAFRSNGLNNFDKAEVKWQIRFKFLYLMCMFYKMAFKGWRKEHISFGDFAV